MPQCRPARRELARARRREGGRDQRVRERGRRLRARGRINGLGFGGNKLTTRPLTLSLSLSLSLSLLLTDVTHRVTFQRGVRPSGAATDTQARFEVLCYASRFLLASFHSPSHSQRQALHCGTNICASFTRHRQSSLPLPHEQKVFGHPRACSARVSPLPLSPSRSSWS